MDLVVPALVLRAVVDGDADVGVTLQAASHPNVQTQASLSCGLVCAMSEGHALAARRQVTASDLAGERIISYPELAPLVIAELDGRAIDLELRSGPSACWFARAGVGVALVDRATVAGAGLNVHWRPFRTAGTVRIDVVSNPARPLSGLAREFIQEFQKVGRTLLR